MVDICSKSPDNQHIYQKSIDEMQSRCIYCGTREPEEDTKGIRTGDAVLNEIPGNEKVKTEQALRCPGKPPLNEEALLIAFATYGKILAIQARIEGMKVRNIISGIGGYSPEYGQAAFAEAGQEIGDQVAVLQQYKK